MMLVTSSHSYFSGVLTLRQPGNPPVTSLIVRGSLALPTVTSMACTVAWGVAQRGGVRLALACGVAQRGGVRRRRSSASACAPRCHTHTCALQVRLTRQRQMFSCTRLTPRHAARPNSVPSHSTFSPPHSTFSPSHSTPFRRVHKQQPALRLRTI